MGYLRTNDGQSIEVNRANDYYEYDKMLLTYDENSSEESKMAVALLMRDISSTGAVLGTDLSTSPAPSSLPYYFGYDKGLIHLPAGYFSQEDMKTIIRSELDAGRPVYVGGSNGFTGHSFICDGYNDKGEFHFNYGWSGKSDGWSTLENCLFPINMEMDFNIKKDEGGAPGFALCSNKDFKWIDSNRIYGNYKFEAYYGYLMELQIALAVENTDTHEVQYFFHTNKNPNSNHDLELLPQHR